MIKQIKHFCKECSVASALSTYQTREVYSETQMSPAVTTETTTVPKKWLVCIQSNKRRGKNDPGSSCYFFVCLVC